MYIIAATNVAIVSKKIPRFYLSCYIYHLFDTKFNSIKKKLENIICIISVVEPKSEINEIRNRTLQIENGTSFNLDENETRKSAMLDYTPISHFIYMESGRSTK